ncbi:MAG: hypothetical protein ACKVOQ_19180 [Cyclobacteriaceae bacterium]
MKKIIRRTIASTVLTLVVLVSGLITLMVFPQSLFANKMEHKSFRVYSNSEEEVVGIEVILDNAYKLTEQCELHNPTYRFDIFLAQDNIFNKIEELQGQGPIARATAGNVTIKVRLDISKNLAFGVRSKVNLTELLAHEMVHILQANKYGLVNFSPIKHPPLWKLEGYPEYISRQAMLIGKDYSLESEIKRYNDVAEKSTDGFIEIVTDHFAPLVYYKGRIMVEYLINVEGLTYDMILDDKRSESQVFNEMVEWMNTK